jgi:AbrB family looped-hinge helix DNA binding protein
MLHHARWVMNCSVPQTRIWQVFILDKFLDTCQASVVSKITGKFQLTLPKRLVDAYGIKVGDEVDLLPAGDKIYLVPERFSKTSTANPEERLRYFDRATERQRKRDGKRSLKSEKDRGWTREELYRRGRPS